MEFYVKANPHYSSPPTHTHREIRKYFLKSYNRQVSPLWDGNETPAAQQCDPFLVSLRAQSDTPELVTCTRCGGSSWQ